ncbi:MAG: rhamnan synthesis F family protein, partial [Rhodanobacter sp.]
VLKLHTKRSVHRQDGEQWRNDLFQRLASPERTTAVLGAFRDRPTLGMAYAEGHKQRLDYYWGANQDNVRALATRLGIPEPQPEQDSFVAGSMFWIRLAALRPLLDAHLDVSAFEPEAGQMDGTLAHAIERILLPCISSAGFESASVASLCGLPESDALYPYARRS